MDFQTGFWDRLTLIDTAREDIHSAMCGAYESSLPFILAGMAGSFGHFGAVYHSDTANNLNK